jgi:CRISPR-associated protein Csx17
VDKDLTHAQIKNYLVAGWEPTQYERWWSVAQKQDSNAKSSSNLWRERNSHSIAEVRLLDAHVVGASRNYFNPILGTGGNIGKRDLKGLLDHANRLISKAHPEAISWVETTLSGDIATDLPDLPGAGTWFAFANKSFNNGQSWYREGRISPWSVLLALEGALLLVGGANRRLGSLSRPYAVFPFISEPSQPSVEGEVGASKGEFWAPLWERPASIVDIRTLFRRGLARLGNRSARAPHEFAIAARAMGVDAGVTEFVRYELRQTTSSRVYEAIPRQRIRVRLNHPTKSQSQAPSDAQLIMQLIESGWLDKLPPEPRDSKQKGKFVGIRGPVEAAIINTSENPDNAQTWQGLLQLLAASQFRIDRNRRYREGCDTLPLLYPSWFLRAWPGPIPEEVRVAQSIASIGAGTYAPILTNIFGVKFDKYGRLFFPQRRPHRAVWHSGDPVRLFTEIARRRLIDVNPTDEIPLRAACPCPKRILDLFIAGMLDIEMIVRWIRPLALIDWSKTMGPPTNDSENLSAQDGNAMLHALFRPFFHPGPIRLRQGLLFPEGRRPSAGLAGHLYSMLYHGHLNEAVQSACNAYHAAGRVVLQSCVDLHLDGNRVAAALLIPMSGKETATGIERWLQPAKSHN